MAGTRAGTTNSSSWSSRGSSSSQKEGSKSQQQLSFVKWTRPWTIDDFMGRPTKGELSELSQALVFPNSKKGLMSIVTSGSSLRGALIVSLGITTKALKIESHRMKTNATGIEAEMLIFVKMFDLWLESTSDPMRLAVIKALLTSKAKSLIPTELHRSYLRATEEIRLKSRVAGKMAATVEEYSSYLDDGKAPLVAIPVCLIGFCGAGKSSLRRLLTATAFSEVTNSTKVASSYSITPRRVARNTVLWSQRTEQMDAATVAAAIKYASTSQKFKGKNPCDILGSGSLTVGDTRPVKRNKPPKPPEKRIPNDVAKLLADGVNATASAEVLIQMMDCGGQPMYLEAIPLLCGPRCVYCIVYNLMWRLDDPAVVKFWQNGRLLQEKVSKKTYMDHIIEWIAVIDCQFAKDAGAQDQPYALFIGTHFDTFAREYFNNDRMEARIEANSLFDRIKATVHDKLHNCRLHIVPFYVDNTTAGSASEDLMAASLRSAIEDAAQQYGQLAMPVSWLCFLHQLRYHSDPSKPIKHLTEVKEIAAKCGVKHGELHSCLQVFHRLALLFHFHRIDDLKGYVFTNLNWFLQELGKVFMVPSDVTYASDWERLLRTGIVTSQLQSFLFKDEYVKGWSLRVLTFLGLAGAIEKDTESFIPSAFFKDSHGKDAFQLPFFPSMIEATADAPLRREPVVFPGGVMASPLFLVFSPHESVRSGLIQYTPPGFLTHLVSRLTDRYGFQIYLDARDAPVTPSFNNQFTFQYGSIDSVTIRGHSDCIQLTVERNTTENRPEYPPAGEVCSSIYTELYAACRLILQQWMPRISVHPCFLCRNCPDYDHFAFFHDTSIRPPTLRCATTMMVFTVEECEGVWIQ